MESQKVNTGFMVQIFATCTIANFAGGFALGGYNAAGIVVETQMVWRHTNTVLIVAAGVLGLMLGSLLTGKIIDSIGRFKSALLANMLVVFSVLPMMWLTVWGLFLGRLLLGFGGGMFTVVCSVFMVETVPAHKLSLYGTSVNLGIQVGLLVTSLV